MNKVITTQELSTYFLITMLFIGILVATILTLVVKLTMWKNRALKAERYIVDSSGGDFVVSKETCSEC